MGHFTRQLAELTKLVSRASVPSQAGIFSGQNPAEYNTSDPIRLWVIQVVIIITLTQLLALVLERIRQPRVIAEVIGGILLGPTVMGRIPNFTSSIFPIASMPLLNLTATIGLVLFLFIVGLEIDTRAVRRTLRPAAAVSVAGLVLPLGLGAAIGLPLYRTFSGPPVSESHFILFTAVAVGITAFPVLCRILTELKLLDTRVGIVTLAAGVGNDVVGWILLALTVALVNAGSGTTAVWVLLAGAGYTAFMLVGVSRAYKWLARRTGSLEAGTPTAFLMTVTLMIVFISAFYTDVIGIHAIFGGFLAGLVIPHDNGLAISLVEKLEDLVSLLFLPLYFTYSGLNTNLGLLNNGITWGYTFLICVVAFSSKFLGCAGVARLTGFSTRESGAIGSLMSCKGLVELIVLNVGLQAGVLDTRTFSMFVVTALILTFLTTPLTLLFYPLKYRVPPETTTFLDSTDRIIDSADETKTRFSVVLDRIEQLPAAMTLTQLLQPPSPTSASSSTTDTEKEKDGPPVTINALRLIELTDRTSAVLKSQEADELVHSDPVVSVFRTFGHLHRLIVSAALSVVSYDEFSASVARHARNAASQMVVVPWAWTGAPALEGTGLFHSVYNPFDGIFGGGGKSGHDQTSSIVYSHFVRRVFADSPTDVALFVDRGATRTGPTSGQQHLFLPFFGGPDDRLALAFVVQLCGSMEVTATVVKMEKTDGGPLTAFSTIEDAKTRPAASQHNTLGFADTVYGLRNTETRLESDTADNLLWARYTSPSSTHTPAVASALSRISFTHHASPQPLHALVELVAAQESGVVVVIGRSRRLAVESHQTELKALVLERGGVIASETPKTLGDVGAALAVTGTSASLLVMQAHA